MAGKSATLAIRIVSDASQASKGFAEAESRVDRFDRGMGRAALGAGALLVGVGAVAKEAFDSASRLQQAGGAVESVFAAQAGAVSTLAKTAADRVGLATASYSELSSVLGSQLKGMGFAGDELVKKNEELITTGADLAATFGGDTSDAVSALSSLLRGERDPIERYGIAISQAAVDAKVAALGLDTSTEASKRNAQAQATLALVAEQSAGAQGAFARESDTAAGAQARAAANFENAKASLGEVLLPVVTQAATKFAELTAFLVENKDAVLIVVGVVSSLAAAVVSINAAISTYRAISQAATAAQWLFNTAMAMNPIGLIIIAIVAVVAAVVLAYNKFEWFRNGVQAVGRAIMGYINLWKTAIEWVIDKLGSIVNNPLTRSVVGLFGAAPAGPAAVGGPSPAGVYGAAGPGAAPALYGASGVSMFAGSGSTGGQSTGPSAMVVNVTINGAVDVIATGRQLEKVLREYAVATGRQLAITVGTNR